MILRPYQESAITATFDYWANGGDNPLVVLATGTGKSLVQADMARRLITTYSQFRVVCVTHVQELIEQNYIELLGIMPFAPAGVYSAGLNRRDANAQILFCGIDSVYMKAALIGHVDLLAIDECHLVPRKESTKYGRFIKELLAINPEMRVVGFTATPYRTDSGRLDDGEERLFDRVVYEYGIADGIRDGFLTKLTNKATNAGFDLRGVGRTGGDFNAKALQAACDKEETTRAAVEEIVATARAENRKSWLAFCAGVEHAYHVRDAIRSHGYKCETITGEMPKGERRLIIERYKDGDIDALTNNSVLTTGSNFPRLDLIAGLRPTDSPGLFVQMVGRGTRLFPGKLDCRYMDFAGNVRRHGPVDAIEPRKPGKGNGEAPVKECAACRELVHISAKECPCCGTPFPINYAPRHAAVADVTPILKSAYSDWLHVRSRTFSHHVNKADEESVKIEFFSGFIPYRTWLNRDKKPGQWNKFWKDHGGKGPSPDNVAEWLERQGELNPTLEIMARPTPDGKFMNVVGFKPWRAPANDNQPAEESKAA
jgi:DNA repair protein RadD